MRTTFLSIISIFLFSSISFASDLIDNPVPDLELVELESAATASSATEEDRTPSSIPTQAASAKDRKNMVMQTISKNFSGLKSCYTQGLKQNADMKGKVVMTWDLDARGKVTRAGIEDSQLKNKNVEECMVKQFSEWHFPSQAKIAGSKDKMTYTFHFVP
ncbi:AgmX/PglI C-terminal domain-containing protein [Bdellovibrio sp. HCB2-146]|uniref:AgmX/PglI C-terminal domain-containing protein n=1 Tax=Bdellovibrio sp. HCB2-146 TaxID=3394362 RepID=UPI0039BCBA89